MEIRIDELKAREMALRLREAFGTADTTRAKSLEVLAKTLGFANWDTLSGMLKKETAEPVAFEPTLTAKFILDKPFEMYWETFSCDEHGDAPSWLKVQVDQAFIDRVLELQANCIRMNLSSLEDDMCFEWHDEENYRIQGESLCVSDTDIWVSGYPKHASYKIEARMMQIDDFLKAIKPPKNESSSTVHLAWADGILFKDGVSAKEFVMRLIENGDLELDETRVDEMPS